MFMFLGIHIRFIAKLLGKREQDTLFTMVDTLNTHWLLLQRNGFHYWFLVFVIMPLQIALICENSWDSLLNVNTSEPNSIITGRVQRLF